MLNESITIFRRTFDPPELQNVTQPLAPLHSYKYIFMCFNTEKFTYSILLTFQWLRYIQILQLRNNLFLVLRNIHCNPLWNGLRHGNPTLLLCWKCSCWWWCRCHCNVVLSTNCVSSSAVEVQTKNLRSLTCLRNFDAFFRVNFAFIITF